jgi:mono/diheme cytochrome c family protein
MSRAFLALLSAAGLLLGGCRTLAEIAPPVSPAMSGDPGALNSGRQVYLQRCASCHSLEAVDDYTPAEWAELLPEMNRKSKLNVTQAEQLHQYLLSAREWKIREAEAKRQKP